MESLTENTACFDTVYVLIFLKVMLVEQVCVVSTLLSMLCTCHGHVQFMCVDVLVYGIYQHIKLNTCCTGPVHVGNRQIQDCQLVCLLGARVIHQGLPYIGVHNYAEMSYCVSTYTI